MFLQNRYAVILPQNAENSLISYIVFNQHNFKDLSFSTEAEFANSGSKLQQVQDEMKINVLKEQVEKMQEKIRCLELENKNLKTQIKPKRHYTARRKNLEKCYFCNVKNCGRIYSSNIALRNHINKKHSKRDSLQEQEEN